MKVYSLMLGSYQTNCYLAADDDGVCAVIDPGDSGEQVAKALESLGLTLRPDHPRCPADARPF